MLLLGGIGGRFDLAAARSFGMRLYARLRAWAAASRVTQSFLALWHKHGPATNFVGGRFSVEYAYVLAFFAAVRVAADFSLEGGCSDALWLTTVAIVVFWLLAYVVFFLAFEDFYAYRRAAAAASLGLFLSSWLVKVFMIFVVRLLDAALRAVGLEVLLQLAFSRGF